MIPRPAASNAAPAPPCTMWPTKNTTVFGATAQAALEIARSTAPITKMRRLPNLSARPPTASNVVDSPRLMVLRIQI